MGIALRTRNPLALDLPALFFKQVVREPLRLRDLLDVDYSTVTSLESIARMDRATFEASVYECWDTALSDGSRVELKPGGSSLPVAFDERLEFVEAVERCRLRESERQCAAVRRGLVEIIPSPLLSLMCSEELAVRACGHPDIDLDLLRRHTQYRGGCSATDTHILLFWRVLESFNTTERRLFLRFTWGREVLPPEDQLASEELKIFAFPSPDPDSQLPVAETCFFILKLPAYSSLEIARQKLLYAILHTRTIDADAVGSNDEAAAAGAAGRRLFGL